MVAMVQTTLRMGGMAWLEEFKKEHGETMRYVLEKYRVWKKLKEEAPERRNKHEVQEPEALRSAAREGICVRAGNSG